FEEETNLRCQIVIDTSSSMYFPNKDFNKLLFSVYTSAALIYLLKKQRDAFGLSLFSDKIEFNSPAKSTSIHQKYLFSQLETLLSETSLGQKTSVADSLHEIAEQIHKRSLVILFSDMLEGQTDPEKLTEIFSALQHLKHNKHEIIVFNVLDHAKELDFEFENRPYQFIDMENGEEMKVQTSQIKASYQKAIENYRQNLKLKCAQFKIDLVDADINQGFYPVLNSYLLKREKLT
ncbi:MAG: VWA domain-containing protein, partial [Daejeonella sp.]